MVMGAARERGASPAAMGDGVITRAKVGAPLAAAPKTLAAGRLPELPSREKGDKVAGDGGALPRLSARANGDPAADRNPIESGVAGMLFTLPARGREDAVTISGAEINGSRPIVAG